MTDNTEEYQVQWKLTEQEGWRNGTKFATLEEAASHLAEWKVFNADVSSATYRILRRTMTPWIEVQS